MWILIDYYLFHIKEFLQRYIFLLNTIRQNNIFHELNLAKQLVLSKLISLFIAHKNNDFVFRATIDSLSHSVIVCSHCLPHCLPLRCVVVAWCAGGGTQKFKRAINLQNSQKNFPRAYTPTDAKPLVPVAQLAYKHNKSQRNILYFLYFRACKAKKIFLPNYFIL